MSKLALEKEEEPEIILPTFAGIKRNEAGIKTDGRNINNLIYADDTALMAESEEELKSLLMKVKEEGESCLKSQYSKNEDHGIIHHFMAN